MDYYTIYLKSWDFANQYYIELIGGVVVVYYVHKWFLKYPINYIKDYLDHNATKRVQEIELRREEIELRKAERRFKNYENEEKRRKLYDA